MDIKEFKANAKMFGALSASAESAAADTPAGKFCELLEAAADAALAKSCGAKQFDERFGNCDSPCREIQAPKIIPCLHLRWGDGPNDRLETDDTEVLCVTVCNPYSNVALNDFTLQIFVLDSSNAPVPTNPDGTPSVQIKPQFNICFGDIPPCDPKNERQLSCVSREVVMINRGAKAGKYKIFVFYCFQACFTQIAFEHAFSVELVSS